MQSTRPIAALRARLCDRVPMVRFRDDAPVAGGERNQLAEAVAADGR
jgi:hypothetical protein